eukprot:Tamp_13576.p4 GENE.Tamp_13576~~Tamp_13576.p4  ORF type:complete len:160 (-),score=37.61 Tamp_13576:511-990(-)
MAVCGKQIPDWINRPAKTGAAALEALNAPLKVLGNIFGTKNTSEMETKATLDRLSQITQVPDTADVMEAEESGKKRSRQGADGSGVKMWLDRPAPTPTQTDTTPSSNKENTPAGRSSDKRRRLSATLEETSASASTKLATPAKPALGELEAGAAQGDWY